MGFLNEAIADSGSLVRYFLELHKSRWNNTHTDTAGCSHPRTRAGNPDGNSIDSRRGTDNTRCNRTMRPDRHSCPDNHHATGLHDRLGLRGTLPDSRNLPLA